MGQTVFASRPDPTLCSALPRGLLGPRQLPGPRPPLCPGALIRWHAFNPSTSYAQIGCITEGMRGEGLEKELLMTARPQDGLTETKSHQTSLIPFFIRRPGLLEQGR